MAGNPRHFSGNITAGPRKPTNRCCIHPPVTELKMGLEFHCIPGTWSTNDACSISVILCTSSSRVAKLSGSPRIWWWFCMTPFVLFVTKMCPAWTKPVGWEDQAFQCTTDIDSGWFQCTPDVSSCTYNVQLNLFGHNRKLYIALVLGSACCFRRPKKLVLSILSRQLYFRHLHIVDIKCCMLKTSTDRFVLWPQPRVII